MNTIIQKNMYLYAEVPNFWLHMLYSTQHACVWYISFMVNSIVRVNRTYQFFQGSDYSIGIMSISQHEQPSA